MVPAGVLSFTSQPPSTIAPATGFGFSVQLRFRGLTPKLQSGVPVIVFIQSGPGTLSGTAQVNTDGAGLATFSGLQLSTSGAVGLRIQAPGYLSLTANITVAAAGTILFNSDWSTATGNSQAALRDTNKVVPWTSTWGGSADLQIVPATGLGFPTGMVNVMRVPVGSGAFGWVMANQIWQAPTLGNWIYIRIYLRIAFAGVVGGYAATHPWESEGRESSVSGPYWAGHWGSQADHRSYWFIDTGGFGSQWTTPDQTGSNPGTLDQDLTYRFELGFQKASPGYNVKMRIIGANDIDLLWDENTLESWGGGPMVTEAVNQNLDDEHVSRLRLGINGGFTSSEVYLYMGGVQVRSDQYPGAYAA